MNLRILNYFLTVAQEQNITRAADILHITQPTLSRQLTQLEEDLGVALLDRSSKKLALTPAGDLLVHRGKEIVALIEKTEQEIKDQETNLSGNISFGAGEYKTVELLADIIKAFQDKYPAVTFDIFTSTADVLKEKMEKGLLDISLLLAPVDITNYNFLLLPYKEKWGILMHSDSPLSAKEAITPEDLSHLPVMPPTRLSARNKVFNWLSGNVANMKFVGTCNLKGNVIIIVLRSRYYAFTIEPSVLNTDELCFRPLDPPLVSEMYLAWRRGANFSPTVQKFIEFAQCFLSMK
ncbi:MAG: LysR family transcriptional regulator [Phascolarctobacterium sp.]|uniref:LysR family transcriptional regulator n=1 Tax=Phascolarctobacterium sp. TaxID=2049039 RepID=UPI0026DCF3BA|nr:LysR family transcriptional regulator [Phascolarctobacterium sp.]MDO4920636.1 LysR family transcriptional regulator [Phascolarctobacterium sp.]